MSVMGKGHEWPQVLCVPALGAAGSSEKGGIFSSFELLWSKWYSDRPSSHCIQKSKEEDVVSSPKSSVEMILKEIVVSRPTRYFMKK